MTTHDSHIGSHCQHRLSDQVSTNTIDTTALAPWDAPPDKLPRPRRALGTANHRCGRANRLLLQERPATSPEPPWLPEASFISRTKARGGRDLTLAEPRPCCSTCPTRRFHSSRPTAAPARSP